MRCPSCRTALAEAVAQCPSCKLTLRRLDTRFGAVPRHSRFVTDRTRSLRLSEIRELRALLKLFHRKFPQSHFSVFVMPGVDGGTIAEYLFWLANRARLSSIGAKAGDNFDVLLGIDVKTRMAALQIGYGLENYLTERDLERALAQSSPFFAADDMVQAVRSCAESMIERMREVAGGAEQERATATRTTSSPADW